MNRLNWDRWGLPVTTPPPPVPQCALDLEVKTWIIFLFRELKWECLSNNEAGPNGGGSAQRPADRRENELSSTAATAAAAPPTRPTQAL